MKKASWIIGMVVVAAALATLGACAILSAEEEGGHSSRLLEAVEILAEGTVTPEVALKTALEKEPGTALDLELELVGGDSDRHLVWEVEILGKDRIRKVAIDLRSGEVVKVEDDEDSEEFQEASELVGSGHVDLARALSALRAAQPGLLLDMELEEEDGAMTYEARIAHRGRHVERCVDPATGRVTSAEEDDDHEGGHEEEDDDHEGGHEHERGHAHGEKDD